MSKVSTGARAAQTDRTGNGVVDRPADPRGVDRGRQREECGGFNIGAAFFGWLVAIGMAALLTAVLSAAGAAIGLTQLTGSEARHGAETISLIGGVLLAAVLILAYFAGGYVAGRMSRFDGGRQGVGAWLFGLLITIALAVAGAIAGSKYNVLSKLNLPSIPMVRDRGRDRPRRDPDRHALCCLPRRQVRRAVPPKGRPGRRCALTQSTSPRPAPPLRPMMTAAAGPPAGGEHARTTSS